ncbi:MAG: sigma-54-dependent Fis family transcriptional regulator [Candidatus Schekmanbacteria bacterium]|nr:MAG: sigma-54-dependent Fis family transcriptional regulator [Candidatus Schekmanbacteria bacterium]
MAKRNKILLIDDDNNLRKVIAHNLKNEGFEVVAKSDGVSGVSAFDSNKIDVVVTDLRLPDIDGMEVLRRIKKIDNSIPIIMITAFGTIEQAVSALKEGAFDYITKPFNRDELAIVVKRAFEFKELKGENLRLKKELYEKFSFDLIVHKSEIMKKIIELLKRIAQTESTVLIEGESGTGKELFAKAIHYNSARKNAPFVTVNCAAIPDELMESELFGHSKGAFTGAMHDRKGKFESADGGTIFLDEVGDLKPNLQAKILRVLQEKCIDKIGSDNEIEVDVRVVAATNRNLKEMVEKNEFREDLYYRLCVVPVKVPPLRERREDIPLLIEHFKKIKENARRLNFSDEAMQILINYDWKGNVRELENLIERMAIVKTDNLVTPEDLPYEIRKFNMNQRQFKIDFPESGISLDEVEKEIIIQALEKNNWNQAATARFLKISRPTLMYRMEKYSITKSQ